MNAGLCRPCLWTLPSTLKTLYMKDLNHEDEAQRHTAFQLITDAARRGDNIGVDEVTPGSLDLMLQCSDVAVVLYDPSRGEQAHLERLLGAVVVVESRFIRSAHPRACQLFVVGATELSGRQTWRDLAWLAVSLAAESRRLYVDCFVEVFVPCVQHVLAMRDEGFVITACIPTAGQLAGHPGYVDSYVMYKQLDTLHVHRVSKIHC